MKAKIIALLAILTLAFTANAKETKENNYDDICNFFATAAATESPSISHFYISKAMLTLTAGQSCEIMTGLNLKNFINKIDFIRSAEIKTNKTKKDKELLCSAEKLATQVYKQYNYIKLLSTNEEGEHNYLFYKYGEGGLCSLLVITILKQFDEEKEESSMQQARVILIGGTFRAEDIPTIINF